MATAKIEALTALEVNGLTGETIIRPLSLEELAQREIDAAEMATMQATQTAKNAARQSALAKLAELGLTQEEIAAL